MKAVIVGGGLFGQITAKALRADGWNTWVYDDRRPEAGSIPAACLIKPSWLGAFGKDRTDAAFSTLDELYGLQEIQFKLKPFKSAGKIGSATVYWVPPKAILGGETIAKTVTRIESNRVYFSNGSVTEADLIVVAAGIWTQELLRQYEQRPLKGIVFRWPEETIEEPFIYPWAPYRQFVAFNRGDGLWASDGTAIIEKNWRDEKHRVNAQMRATQSLGITDKGMITQTGIRPYSKEHKPCIIERVRKGLWVASGGAKNGTLAAAWCAHVIRTQGDS